MSPSDRELEVNHFYSSSFMSKVVYVALISEILSSLQSFVMILVLSLNRIDTNLC